MRSVPVASRTVTVAPAMGRPPISVMTCPLRTDKGGENRKRMRVLAATGLPSRVAGSNCIAWAAVTAASSNPCPTGFSTRAFLTSPDTPTVTMTETSTAS